MTRRVVVGSAGMIVALAVGLPAVASAQNRPPAAAPVITAPANGALVAGASVRVRVRSTGPAFRVLAGTRDVTRRFTRPGKRGVRVAVLRRGHELSRGFNRVVVYAGRGERRRTDVVRLVVASRKRGALRVTRVRSRASLRLRLRQLRRTSFSSLRVTVNGRRVRTRDWLLGSRVPSTQWPVGRARFDAVFGANDGLRFGRNTVRVTAWNRRGVYDGVVLRVRLNRPGPIAAATGGRTARVHRSTLLDARQTRPRKGAKLAFRWRIVRRPKGSHARLRNPGSARPRLVTDRRGRYRIRLTARYVPRKPGARASQAPPAGATTDAVTVVATPPAPAIGWQIQTMSGGGVHVGSSTYPSGGSGTWAQLVVLDRQSLELVSNQSFGSDGQVILDDIEDLQAAVDGLDSSQLAILTGGGRSVSTAPAAFFVQLDGVFGDLGGDLSPANSWPNTFQQSFMQGRWSLVGVPGTDDAGYENLYGMIYGQTAGAGSQPGELTGYLQPDQNGNYTFASGNYSSIDTNVPGAPPGVNQIQIGDDVYSSSAIPQPGGGFHVLILDSMLQRTSERTFVTNPLGGSDAGALVQMQEYISDATAPGGLGTPGYLVIVQSIGQPFGVAPMWVNDQPLIADSFGTNGNTPVPRDDSTWFGPNVGETLAGALGVLGGGVAHDQLAQMIAGGLTQPDPAYNPGGYTLVASTGAVSDSVVTNVSTPPTSRSQAGSGAPAARVVGTLERDQQSLWAVSDDASTDGWSASDFASLVYQAPTQWPLSSTPAQQAAIQWISVAAGFGKNVRTSYVTDFDGAWTDYADQINEVTYPGAGEGFDEATFDAVQHQLYNEALMVNEVKTQVKTWQGYFQGTSSVAALIDIQDLASDIAKSIDALDTSSNATAETDAVLGESLWTASSVLDLTGQEEISGPLGALASLFDLASDVAGSSSGGPSSGSVETTAGQLGADLADRFDDITDALEVYGQILVNDWGKLQTASQNTKDLWATDATVQNAVVNAVNDSTRIEIAKALLASTYGIYVVDPQFVNSVSRPSDLYCRTLNSNAERVPTVRVFGDADGNPASWITRVVGFDDDLNPITRYAGMTIPVDVHSGQTVRDRAGSAPQAVTSNLFDTLEVDPVALMADNRFQQQWFYCAAQSD